MVGKIKVRETDRDDNFAISVKEITLPGNKHITTPNKSFSAPSRTWKQIDPLLSQNIDVNEVNQRMDDKKIELLGVDGTSYIQPIRRRYLPDKVNFYMPHLRLRNNLSPSALNLYSQFLYSVSEEVIILPTIDFSWMKILKPGTKSTKIWSQDRVDDYITYMKSIVENINAIGNGKAFMGMIPLMPSDRIKDLIKFYIDEGINSFVIDASTRDIVVASQFEFRALLGEIRIQSDGELFNKFFYASNLGYGNFKQDWSIADDFLSIYTNIDVLGHRYKTRGFDSDSSKNYVPKAKVFSKDDYAYTVSTYKVAEENLNIEGLNPSNLRKYNENEQKTETNNLQRLIGEVNLDKHLLDKKYITPDSKSYKQVKTFSTDVE